MLFILSCQIVFLCLFFLASYIIHQTCSEAVVEMIFQKKSPPSPVLFPAVKVSLLPAAYRFITVHTVFTLGTLFAAWQHGGRSYPGLVLAETTDHQMK